MTFEEFLAAELTGLSRYAAVLTGERERAHDVLADALVKVHADWHRIGAMHYPLAYVRRVVTSVYISDGRRWAARMIRPTRTGELPEVALPDPTDGLDERAHFSALLGCLPPRQRAAIVLRYYLGYDNAGIATDLGITAGAVRTAISRGMAALRIAVTESDDGYDAVPGSDPRRSARLHQQEGS